MGRGEPRCDRTTRERRAAAWLRCVPFCGALISACGPDPCEDAPPVAWEDFGAGFMLAECQPCHASGAPDRHDAPEDVAFDDEEQVLSWSDRIVDVAATEPPSMPPDGGTTAEDRALLRAWLLCGD